MIFVLACCLTAGITGSVVYAYLIDQKETVNQIRILENTTHIEEEFEPPDEVKPGQVIKKKPCIANDSGFPVFIRARVIFSNDRGEAQCQPLEIADSWKKGEDGYYYYQKKVLSGQRTDVKDKGGTGGRRCCHIEAEREGNTSGTRRGKCL